MNLMLPNNCTKLYIGSIITDSTTSGSFEIYATNEEGETKLCSFTKGQAMTNLHYDLPENCISIRLYNYAGNTHSTSFSSPNATWTNICIY